MNLSDASRKYIDSLRSDTSTETIRLYERGCKMFTDVVGDKAISEIRTIDFDKYCQHINREAKIHKWSARTQHAYTRGIVGLLTYLDEIELITISTSSLWKIRQKRIAKVDKPIYKLPKGVNEFLDKLYTFPAPPPTDKKVYQRFLLEHAFVCAIASSGARIHEVCRLAVNAFNGNRAIVRGKGKKSGYIYFTGEAMTTINKWISERETQSLYLFPAFRDGKKGQRTLNTETGRQIVYKWITMILGYRDEDFTPHTFRHYAIISGIKQRGLRWAQIQARHAEPGTTAAYDETNFDEIARDYDEVYSRKSK